MEIKPDISLSEHTTFRLGGKALFYAQAESESEVKDALEFAKAKNLPVFILGGGSNVLVSDQGFLGLVVHIVLKGLEITDSGLLTVAAGENWDDVVSAAVEKKLAGVECLSGVPGTAGGAVVQNIGAYGQTIGDLVKEVWGIETSTGLERKFRADEIGFEYRSSFFKKTPGKFVVTKFMLQLTPNGEPTIKYPHVGKHFGDSSPSISEVREFIIKLRASKGYVILPQYERLNTAGSFYKNPIISASEFEKIKDIFGSQSLNRFWPAPNGVKLAAAFLVQEAGFPKGYREGHVGISPKHTLSLINFSDGKASEILSLSEKIKQAVKAKFGVELEEEVLFV